MTTVYVVVAGEMTPPEGARWAHGMPTRVSGLGIIQCGTKTLARELIADLHRWGWYAEMFDGFASARIDAQFRRLSQEDP